MKKFYHETSWVSVDGWSRIEKKRGQVRGSKDVLVSLENRGSREDLPSSHNPISYSTVIHQRRGPLQRFDRQPQYTEVNPNEDARLTCTVLHKKGHCSWQKDGKSCNPQNAKSNKLPTSQRMRETAAHPVGMYPRKYEWVAGTTGGSSMDPGPPAAPPGGDCSIIIRSASLEFDDGEWECQVTSSDFATQDALTSAPVRLVVREIEDCGIKKPRKLEVSADKREEKWYGVESWKAPLLRLGTICNTKRSDRIDSVRVNHPTHRRRAIYSNGAPRLQNDLPDFFHRRSISELPRSFIARWQKPAPAPLKNYISSISNSFFVFFACQSVQYRLPHLFCWVYDQQMEGGREGVAPTYAPRVVYILLMTFNLIFLLDVALGPC
ncbi:hypothetical protein B566_EDAN002720 [Ephemera danica]|nr:hypothetical protein B566_EDAN002720 [Ephemera danica]